MTDLGEPTVLFGRGLDGYELIGRGGSGAVYRATDETLGRTVAVKVLHVVSLGGEDQVPAEAIAQSKVSWHGNVLTLYSSGRAPDGSTVLVLEYAPGGSLDDRIGIRGPMSPAEWFRLGEELAGALAAAHELGVIHCDVKPSNVLFAADGSARLADFGIARNASVRSQTMEPVLASLQFAPPELLEGARPTTSNDIYSLAVTLCYAASGRLPFGGEGQSPAAIVARIQAGDIGSGVVASIPDELRSLIKRAITEAPEDRPSADELRRAFESASRGGPPPVVATAPSGGRPRHLAVVLLVVAALVGAVLVAARTERPITGPVAPPDLCTEFAKYVDEREDLLTRVSSDMEQATSPTDVVERLMVTYPAEFSRIVRPFLNTVVQLGGTAGDITDAQLAKLAAADNLRALGGGKQFVFDGETGAFDAAPLPMELQIPAQMFSEANGYASDRCSSVRVNLQPVKARLSSAIFSNLANPGFMDRFFEDPRSYDLFNPSTTLLMASMAWDFFEGILLGHFEWFLEMLNRQPDVRRALAMEYPEIYLAAAAASDELSPKFLRESWQGDVIAGIRRASPATRRGILEMYPDLVSLLDMEGL